MQRVNNWTRREFALALASITLTACPICRAARAQQEVILCASAKKGTPDEAQWLKTSGDSNLDRILAAELIAQSKFFGKRPAFLLYSGSNHNAFATTKTELSGTQGSILYNLEFLKIHLLSTKWGGAVVSGIIAHEFAHIFQFFTDYMNRLAALHTTVKFQELHADFLSGFYMGKKHSASPIKLDDYFDAFYALGDYKFDSKDHHGTRAERYFAIKAGYNLSIGNRGQSIDFAASQGEAFLKEYFR